MSSDYHVNGTKAVTQSLLSSELYLTTYRWEPVCLRGFLKIMLPFHNNLICLNEIQRRLCRMFAFCSTLITINMCFNDICSAYGYWIQNKIINDCAI